MKPEEKEPKTEALLTVDPEIVREAREAEAKEATSEAPSLQEVIKKQATEDEADLISGVLSLRKILGGDILTTSTIRQQVWLFLLIGVFLIIYTSNRYSCQHDLIKIDNLQQELQSAKYKALSSGSQLTEMSRQSNVMDMLRNNKDTMLHIASQPPFKIKVPK